MAQSMNPSGTPLNLLYINCSPPSDIPEAEWERWLRTIHIPAALNSGTVIRAALYKETGFAMIPQPSHPLEYMLLYQTGFNRLQDSETYIKAYEDTGAEKYDTVADNDTRNYKLIQDYNPFEIDDQPGPQLLTVEMHPDDREDFEDWYRRDLLPKLSSLPGYRRCRRYQITTSKNKENHYLAIHELENLSKAFKSQAQHDEVSTPSMEKHIEASEKTKTERGGGFVRRGWALVHASGYQVDEKELQIESKTGAGEDSETSLVETGCFGFKRMLFRLFGKRTRAQA